MTRRRTRRRNGFDEDDDAGRTTATPEEEERRDEKKTASSFNGTVRPFVASEHPVTPAVRYFCFSPTVVNSFYNELLLTARFYLIYSNTKTQEAYGFVGIVASSLIFLFHLLLLFSPPLTDLEEEYKKESALFRFVSFSKHHAKALPLWMTLCVMLYVVLVECSSRMKVYDLGDGRLLTHTKKKKSDYTSKSGQFVGQSVSASAWNEALFSGKKKSR